MGGARRCASTSTSKMSRSAAHQVDAAIDGEANQHQLLGSRAEIRERGTPRDRDDGRGYTKNHDLPGEIACSIEYQPDYRCNCKERHERETWFQRCKKESVYRDCNPINNHLARVR